MNGSSEARIAALYRHPIKGLSPERIVSTELKAGDFFPCDRLFAIENGPSGFDPGAPAHLPKSRFLMLMRQERLASIQTRYDESSESLSWRGTDGSIDHASLKTREGRKRVEAFFERVCRTEALGSVRLLGPFPRHRFTDAEDGYVSLLNLASVRELSERVGRALDPRRFRANLWIEGLEPWAERSWPGARLAVGAAVLRIVRPIDRCAAVDVDPRSALRDTDLVRALLKMDSRKDCGVYAQVVSSGPARAGDPVGLIQT